MESNKEKWFQLVKELYEEKINHFIKFEVTSLKAPKLGRDHSESKKKLESEMFLKYLKPEDLVVLLDEEGKKLSSLELAQWIEKEGLVQSYKRIVMIIGGAFGVSEEVKKRSRLTLQMGPWTLNHLVAQTVLMEQIYRSFTILKGLPYHNQ
jgi:23S rRNA (pseudouridine1915-N3)-methyltransferase